MSKTKTLLQQAFYALIFYLFFTKEFVLSFTVPQLFSAPAQLLCMGAQGGCIREELTATIWRATGTACFGGSALGYRKKCGVDVGFASSACADFLEVA